MNNNLPKAKEWSSMSISARLRAAEEIGSIVGKTIQKAVEKCNKLLKKYGYSVSVTLQFHELDKE